MIVTEREREAETQAEGEAGSMYREPDMGFDPGSPGSRPGPKAGAKPLRHPGIPASLFFKVSSTPNLGLELKQPPGVLLTEPARCLYLRIIYIRMDLQIFTLYYGL